MIKIISFKIFSPTKHKHQKRKTTMKIKSLYMQSLTNVSPIAQIARVFFFFVFLYFCFRVQRKRFFFFSFLLTQWYRTTIDDGQRKGGWKRRECLRREWRKKNRILDRRYPPPPSAFSFETLFFNTHTNKSRQCFDPFDTT